jgi:hydroxymethylbilane synthase
LGTRGSALARWQAEWIADQLRAHGTPVDLVLITTGGDVRRGPIGALGTRGVFTKEIQQALLDEQIDVAVHSLKDLPTEGVEGLVLAAVPPRERPGDALVTPRHARLSDLDAGARVGTGSVRRRAQLLYAQPDLTVCDIRGNVDTRLRQLDEGRYEALILAEAGLIRLGLAHRIAEVLPTSWMLPAVGQGALGLEVRANDGWARACVAALDDAATHAAVAAERTLLAALGGGCLAPIAAWARQVADTLQLDAAVLDPAGTRRVAAQAGGPPDAWESVGLDAARQLLAQGAAELIAGSRARD